LSDRRLSSPTVEVVTDLAPTRNVVLDGVFNFRDLGGYPTRDARSLRWRTLFRADGLGRLTVDDLETLRPIALKTVVDLRTTREIDERGRFPFETYPVAFHHLSVVDSTWDRAQARIDDLPATEFLHRAYTTMLAEGAERFAAVFGLLAGTDALPAVFHCAAGKDRTGLLAALLLGALGVEAHDVVADYALTQATMDRFLERVRSEDPGASLVDAAPQAFFAAEPAAMARVLDDIEQSHGSVRDFVRGIGVEADVLERLEDLLLVDD
jgi:protein-tyrosine phosphatase